MKRTGIIMAKDPWGYDYPVLVGWKDHARLKGYAWRISVRGYAYRKTSIRRPGRRKPSCIHVYMHRDITGLPIGDPRVPDHRNSNKLDNRRGNLRIVDLSGNALDAWEKRRLKNLAALRAADAAARDEGQHRDMAKLAIRAIFDVPPFVGPDMQTYELRAGQVAEVPLSVASILVRRNRAHVEG